MLKHHLRLLYHQILARGRFLRGTSHKLDFQPRRRLMLLSFDCDSQDDMECLPGLVSLLDRLEIHSSFALCGALVETHGKAASSLGASGHEIVNHGYSVHTGKNSDGRGFSTMFYRDCPAEMIEKEITDNHQVLRQFFNREIHGFRTPHFGTFQGEEELSLIYRILHRLGYLYSSSRCPAPQPFIFMPRFNLYELPLTPCPVHRETPYDSWHMLAAPGKEHKDSDLTGLFSRMIAWADATESSYVFNFYFDPSHLMKDMQRAWQFLSICRGRGLECLTYSEFVRLIQAENPALCT